MWSIQKGLDLKLAKHKSYIQYTGRAPAAARGPVARLTQRAFFFLEQDTFTPPWMRPLLCYAGDDTEFRRESRPWADWLKPYLPDLLLTVYRAARRKASLSHTLYFDQLQNPEHFLDSVSEFHHSNFCDVRILRFEEADTASSAGTPAQTKRQRR